MRMHRVVGLAVAVAFVAPACWYEPHDYDWDRRADLVWYVQDGTSVEWWSDRRPSAPLGTLETTDGVPVAGDFDGDGRYDLAVATFFDTIELVGGTTVVSDPLPPLVCDRPAWAPDEVPGMLPVTGDVDGDRTTELGWYCATSATWFLPGLPPVVFGEPLDPANPSAYDVPALLDHDGDGTAEVAVYRVADGTWWVDGESEPIATDLPIGLPVPADYDGDGTDDPAVFQLVDGTWHFADGTVVGGPGPATGEPGYLPAPADYDGDGDADLAALFIGTSENGTFHVDDGRAVSVPAWAHPVALAGAGIEQVLGLTFMALACDADPVDTDHCPRA